MTGAACNSGVAAPYRLLHGRSEQIRIGVRKRFGSTVVEIERGEIARTVAHELKQQIGFGHDGRMVRVAHLNVLCASIWSMEIACPDADCRARGCIASRSRVVMRSGVRALRRI